MFFNFLLLQNAQLVRALQPSLMPTSNQLSIDWRHDDAPSPPSQSDRSPNDNQKNTYTLIGICVLLFAITGGALIYSCALNCSHDRHRDRSRSTYDRFREVNMPGVVDNPQAVNIPYALHVPSTDDSGTANGDTIKGGSVLPVADTVAPITEATRINHIRW